MFGWSARIIWWITPLTRLAGESPVLKQLGGR